MPKGKAPAKEQPAPAADSKKPPARRANIVKSGNAGSAKSTSASAAAAGDPDRPAPLFPVGYKTPLSLLYERCQKNGWEKPSVDTRKGSSNESWTGSVTLKRKNAKTGGIDTVYMRPPPTGPMSVDKPTAMEAKHWVAVYALFRFSNNLRLNLQLPPQTRDYWAALEKEKSDSGPAKQWLWSTTPFEAQPVHGSGSNGNASAATQDKQASAKSTPGTSSASTPRSATPISSTGVVSVASKWWREAPEVRMPVALRDLVEETVRSMMSAFDLADVDIDYGQHKDPEASYDDGERACLADFVSKGFRKGYVVSAINYVKACKHTAEDSDDPLVLSFATQSLDQAVLKYLFLHTPEEDLPPSLRTARPADAAARIATSRDSDELALRWKTERISKDTGFPLSIVEAAMRDASSDDLLAIDLCVRRLALQPSDALSAHNLLLQVPSSTSSISETLEQRRRDELAGLEGIFGAKFVPQSEGCEIFLSKPRGLRISIRFFLARHSAYPSSTSECERAACLSPVFYTHCPDLPSFIRLHFDSLLMRRLNDERESLLDAGYGGAITELASYLEEIVEAVIEHPPDARQVLAPLLAATSHLQDSFDEVETEKTSKGGASGPRRRRKATAEDHAAIFEHHQKVMADPEYEKIRVGREKLPAASLKDQLVKLIGENRVTIVSGETGSGKTTQVPTFVLDDLILRKQGGNANIIVTQPRRVSAIGVATRVAYERLEDINNSDRRKLIGYAIRGERKASRDCKMLFCTTGVVLARLSRGGDSDLADVSHIFIDEVHERSVDSDFLLLELRDILKRNKSIKVILMSATINQREFSDYFGGAPCVEIPGFTHPVQDHYLEDLLPQLSSYQSSAKPARKASQALIDRMRESFMARGVQDERTLTSLERLARSERIDYELVGLSVAHCLNVSKGSEGGILVFMTGVAEINQAIEAIRRAVGQGERVEVFPLHANLSSAEQTAVFRPTKLGVRKVVVATNVAETSITIDGIVYVVDCGRVKENTFDPETNIIKLVEKWTSRAAAKQRRGRAGRTRPGQCYKLFTRWTEENDMPAQPLPEIQRIPLEMLCLQIKAMRSHEDVKAYLSRALAPPDTKAVDTAWSTLVQLGAVYTGGMTAALTPLGRHLSMLPLDLRLGKMLILSCVFRCLDPILTIVSMLSCKPFFVSPPDQRDAAKKARSEFYAGTSDLLSDLKAFTACQEARSKGNAALRAFAEEHFVSLSAFRDIASVRTEYIIALSDAGLLPFRTHLSDERWNVNSSNENLVKAILYAGTRRLVSVKLPQAMFDKGISGAIERDREAKEIKFFEPDGRVFLHPSSLLFEETKFASRYLTYWNKHVTSKPFLRDATQIPMYALLLFGPEIQTNIRDGDGYLVLGSSSSDGEHAPPTVMRAWPRIGVLISALRILFDRDLARRVESPDWDKKESAVIKAMLKCVERDGRI